MRAGIETMIDAGKCPLQRDATRTRTGIETVTAVLDFFDERDATRMRTGIETMTLCCMRRRVRMQLVCVRGLKLDFLSLVWYNVLGMQLVCVRGLKLEYAPVFRASIILMQLVCVRGLKRRACQCSSQALRDATRMRTGIETFAVAIRSPHCLMMQLVCVRGLKLFMAQARQPVRAGCNSYAYGD